MKRLRYDRGAAMTETALVVGAILTILLFGMQLGIIGFLQTTADAASFVDARLAAVGTNSGGTAENATSAIFHQFSTSRNELTSTVNPAPTPSVPVDYGYNSSNANEQSQSQYNRHGGVTMLQPTLSTSTVHKNGIFSIFGFNVGVASTSIDASWLECGIHQNVSNSNAQCGSSGNNANASNSFQGDYFKNGENPPPYFVSLDYIHHCNDAQPFGLGANPCGSCSNSGTDFIALGTAAYLQSANWAYPSPGVGGAGGSDQTTTFQQLACHQRMFATVAAFFADYPTLSAIYNGFLNNPNHPIYDELYDPSTYENFSSQKQFNSFVNFTGFTGTAKGNAASAAIRTIYSWDRTVTAGYPLGSGTPGTYALHPGNGCT